MCIRDSSYLLDYCSGDTLAIANAVELADQMNAKVVIEGVEENGQLSAMQALDLDYYQGFYLAKPNSIHHWTEQKAPAKVLH